MKKLFAGLTVLAATLIPSVALGNTKTFSNFVDLGQIESGVTYDLSSYGFRSVVGRFTAPSSGIANIYADDFMVFSTMTFVDSSNATADEADMLPMQYVQNGLWTFEAEAGTTYYIASDFLWNDTSLKVEMSGGFAVTGCWPEEGSAISATGDAHGSAQVGLSFNYRMQCESIFVLTGEGANEVSAQATIAQSDAQPTSVWTEIGDILTNWFLDGTLDPAGGQEIRVTFNGLATRTQDPFYNEETGEMEYGEPGELLDGTGVYTLTFLTAPKPISVVSVDMPEAFLSYFTTDDPTGEIVLTFDGPVSSYDYTQCGVVQSGSLIALPFSTDGNKFIIDLRGEVRKLTAEADGTVQIALTYMPGADGQWVIGNVPSAVCGSFAYYLPYREISADVYSEYTPASGSTLVDAKTLDVYLHGISVLRFDGFRFDYVNADSTTGTVTVDMADVTVTEGSDDDADYHLYLPVAVRKAASVVVSLNNLVNLDGVDHSADTSASFTIVATEGIESLATDNASSDAVIYNMQGMRLRATSTRDLPAGLYIVNGKKQMVR